MDELDRAVGEPVVGSYLDCIGGLNIDKTKITDYLLSTDHPVGAAKAQYFLGRGFSINDWQSLRAALVDHVRSNKIVKLQEHPYGTKVVVECNLKSPAGDDHCIRAIWNFLRDGSHARLITAHPL